MAADTGRKSKRAGVARRRTARPRPQTTAPVAPRQVSQRDALLDEAARQFNARGIAAISVNDVAKRIGLTRAAVYYYVEDSEDLVFQTYMRSCQLTAEDLAQAHDASADDLDRIEAFIRRTLSPQRPLAAVVSEIAYLSAPRRALVEAEHARNVSGLEQLVRNGIRAGTIRECDARLVAQAIIGILSWVTLSPGWVVHENDAGPALRLADAIVEQLDSGLVRKRPTSFQCRIDVRSLVNVPANLFDRDLAAALKTEQVLETASRLFNERGLDGASLEQIATALGATKGVLYHYFTDKRELILRCYERSAELDEKFADLAEQTGRTGLERAMIGLHLNVQAQIVGPSPLVPLVGFESLPPGPRKSLQRRLTRLHERFTQFGNEGIADGSIRRCDVAATALAGAGIFGWLPKWLPADARDRRWEIADQMVDLWMHGLRA